METNQSVYVAMAALPSFKHTKLSEGAVGPAVGSSFRVLIVEEDYLVGTMTEKGLPDAGYEVVGVAASGEEAVHLARELRPALILMDIWLAGEMTGIEAAIQLREIGIPSLFASAHTDSGTQNAGDQARPLGWLAKPYSDAEVLAAVAGAIQMLNAQ